MQRKFLIVLAAISLSFAVCGLSFGQEAAVSAVSAKVVTALKNNDLKTLATLVHPTKGVRFSPYSYITVGKDNLVFKKSQLGGLFASRKIYDWGAYDAGEDEIKMTFAEYYKTFVYNQNFAAAPNVKYNEVIRHGNSLVNIAEAYPNGKFVEYNFPGTEKNGQMDWNSLRLIFEKSAGKWYLVGISHDQWTT